MTTLPSFIRESLADEQPVAFCERDATGAWVPTSSSQARERIDDITVALREIRGIAAGHRVAVMAPNSVDWLVSDYAALSAGLIVVPIFPTQAHDQVEYIFENSETKLVFIDTQANADKLRAGVKNVPPIVVFEGDGPGSLRELAMQGAARRRESGIDVTAYTAATDPNAMAVLIYTSGTTGQPKGVMLSHRNIISNVTSSSEYAFGITEKGDNVLSVLPFSHIYEHTVGYVYLRAGVALHICRSADGLLADLREVRPVMMTSVPRIFERILAGIVARAKGEGGMSARLVPWALDVGRDYMRAVRVGPSPSLALRLQYALAHTLVLKKIRPGLGLDRLLFFCSGSAPLHLDTALTFAGADIEIVEGYGPTECSPVITVNRLNDNHLGTVGRAIPGVELRIAEDGEIMARGPNVMLGYYHDAAATAAVMHDGFYATGDIGEVDADGFLRITDRKKELFKTSQGKFIAPVRIETALKRSVYIGQAIIVGASRSFPSALIAPFWDLVAKEVGIDPTMPTVEMSKRPEVRALIQREVAANVEDLAKFEQIRLFAILPRDLTVEDGELSPTLKVRRRVVEEKYAELIDSIYRAVVTR